jgi:FimV-like protein
LLAALSDDACAPATPDASAREVAVEEDLPTLPSAHVQLALAQEFRDLGLWDEARARLQEVLEQPDAGQHAQAQALLKELQQLAPAPPLPLPTDDAAGQ